MLSVLTMHMGTGCTDMLRWADVSFRADGYASQQVASHCAWKTRSHSIHRKSSSPVIDYLFVALTRVTACQKSTPGSNDSSEFM